MKKTIITLICLTVLAAPLFANAPNEKVLKIFNETFSSPKDATWYDHTDFYDVSFVQAGIRSTIKYDKEGNFLSSIRYYGQENLPVNIACQLNKRFPKKKLFGVTEWTTSQEVTYYIKLEDEKFWTTLKVSNNGLVQVYEKYRKA